MFPGSQNGRHRPHLRVEALEDRWCPSVTLATDNGTLFITGDETANEVRITQTDSSLFTLKVESLNGQFATRFFNSSEIKKIVAVFGAGEDKFQYVLPEGKNLEHGKRVVLRLGQGDDVASLFLGGDQTLAGNTSMEFIQADLKVDIYGGQGNDYIEGDLAAIQGSQLLLNAWLGKGDDYLEMDLEGDVSNGAEVRVDVRGGGGGDTLQYYADYDFNHKYYDDISISADSVVDVKLRGENGPDYLFAKYGGYLNGSLKLRAKGHAGVDQMNLDLYVAPSSIGALDAIARASGGDDHLLAFDVSDNSGQLAFYRAILDGGLGEDSTDFVSANVEEVNIP
jgi:hypothetical protein